MIIELDVEYVVLTYLQTAGRWQVLIHLNNGEEYSTIVKEGNPEEYLKKHFPEVQVKIYDWRTKSWSDGKESA